MSTQTTIQDLKRYKSYIIAKITKLGCEDHLKSYMNMLLLEVEFGTTKTVAQIVMDVFNAHYRARAKRSGQKLAEIIGNNEKRHYDIMTKEFTYNN